MKNYISCLLFLLVFSSWIPTHNDNSTQTSDENTKYVMGGLDEPGDGSVNHPYNSLALAQNDTSWETLVVLSSNTPLDGGITLRPKTSLIGDKSQNNKFSHTINQPMITNSSPISNGGNGIIVAGDEVNIQNIFIKDTWAAAIRYDNAENLKIEGVKITGHNQGELTECISNTNHTIAAIHGQSNMNGSVQILSTTVSDNYCGNAILDIAHGSAKRTIYIRYCNFKCLNKYVNSCAVEANSYGINAHHEINIYHCQFSKFYPNKILTDTVYATKFLCEDGAKQQIAINECSFNNITNISSKSIYSTTALNNSCAILIQSITVGQTIQPQNRSNQKAKITGCYFYEPKVLKEFKTNTSIGIQKETRQSISTLKVNKSKFTQIDNSILSFVDGNSKDIHTITHNEAKGTDSFYAICSESHPELYGLPKSDTSIKINHNHLEAGENFGAVLFVSSLNSNEGVDAPWDILKASLKNNKLIGSGLHSTGIVGVDFGSSGAGKVEISGSKNEFSKFSRDIIDFDAGANFTFNKCQWSNDLEPVLIYSNTTGVAKITNSLTQYDRNPYFNTYTLPENFYLSYLKDLPSNEIDQLSQSYLLKYFLKRKNTELMLEWPRKFLSKKNNYFELHADHFSTLNQFDHNALKEVYAQAYRKHGKEQDIQKHRQTFETILKPQLSKPSAILLTAKKDGAYVGFATFEKISNHEAWLVELVVDPMYTQQRLATCLLNTLHDFDPEIKTVRIFLDKEKERFSYFLINEGFKQTKFTTPAYDHIQYKCYTKTN